MVLPIIGKALILTEIQIAMRLLTLLLSTLFISLSAQGQVFYDFEDDVITQWYSEGDGDFELNTTDGLPGQCLQVNDDATGDMVMLITPFSLIGDWSGATLTDSITYDLKPISSDPDLITGDPFLIQLNGPGGSATALPDFVPAMNQWQRIAVPIDPAAWTVTSGNWGDLLADVTLIRIRAEFITGDEYVLMDNIGLSFSPAHGALGTPQVCSTFDLPDNLDGWGFLNVSSADVDTAQGVLPNALRIGDESGVLGICMAPPKFRGDWSAVDGTGTIDLDIMVQTSATSQSERPFAVRISGAGGAATINVANDQVQAAKNAWTHWTLPIEEAAWTVETGDWTSLLQEVAEIKVQLEYFSGDETVYVDNFCIGSNSGTGIREQPVAGLNLWPNPTSDLIYLPAGQTARNYEVIDTRGAVVMAGIIPASNGHKVDVRALKPGSYALRLIGPEGIAVGRFLR